MLKTPISFKGPIGQIEEVFSESTVFDSFKYLLQDCMQSWRFNEESQISYAVWISDGIEYHVNMPWPLQQETPGKCSCEDAKPCVHLAALAIQNKSKLDILPPFTQQVRALKNVIENFANWLNQQEFDPFPRMARHRLIYVINESESGHLSVQLFKAYLSQDDKYTVKDKIDSSIYFKKTLPKFISLADQHVLELMSQLGLANIHRFNINEREHQDLLIAILKTKRCFWKACYRPAIGYDESIEIQNTAPIQLTKDLYFILGENTVVNKIKPLLPIKTINIQGKQNLKARLKLFTTWTELDWKPEYSERIDWAKISFNNGKHEFDLADMSEGIVYLDHNCLEQIAGFCFQIEKLLSVKAKYEGPIADGFHINDRYLPSNFTSIAPLLLALKQRGWKVDIDDSYRLNNQKINQFYVQIEKRKVGNLQDWFDVEVGIKYGNESINLLPYLVKAIKTGQFDSVKRDLMIKLDDGQFIDIPKSKVEQIMATLNELYDEKLLDENQKLSMNSHQLLRLSELSQAELDEEDTEYPVIKWAGYNELKSKIEELSSIKTLATQGKPEGLKASLRPYQQTGMDWLKFLSQHNFHGILADDMGLGKTLQVLAHLLSIHQEGSLKSPVLVVAPTSLLGNWHAEIEKFTPVFKSIILSGQHRTKYYKNINEYQIVITSYGVMSRDYRKLSRIKWHTMVLDEAQAIKNRKTQVAKMAKTIEAKNRICLTGTPLENHLGEIWSLFDYLMPGFLASEKLFQKLYQWPIERDQDKLKLEELQNRLAPFILRRTKSEVAKELPDKNEIIKFIELSEQQADVYESIRITMSDEIRKAIKNQKNNQILIGNALLRLRQVCCHPSLLKLSSVEQDIDSSKLNWLKMVLPNLVEEGRRVLIFSSFTSMLDIIAKELKAMKIDFFELTGKTPSTKRTEYINAFQAEEVPVFLISLKAGGAGINLTAADTVIHYDPWWNPAAEQQASDRAHRIGQDKQVFIYKLITLGTVEEKIHQLQQQKQQLAENLLAQTGNISEILSEHQWQNLLSPVNEEG